MILKKLTVSGFKSFSDKTDFDFHEGVTCIVGPNGCGKSNVVDAVKWVLGEQSAKSLRGGHMSDMIFNGSSTRRSSGVAQVDLTFDNSDHTLNMEQSEVVVSRRLYRSGDSEYLINMEVCRLKDVKELFLDTGVGVDAYSVIEQGKVDVLLQSNPQERRAIFEEAAGISKYKVRRREAERKLDRTQQNLARVQDIIEELEKRLRSVKIQATKARKFQEYDQQLRSLKASYAMAEYHRLHSEQKTHEQWIAQVTDDHVESQATLSKLEATSTELASRSMALDEQIDRNNATTTTMKSTITALEERMQASDARQGEFVELLEGYRERAEQDRQRCEQTEQAIIQEQQKLPVMAEQLAEQAAIVTELSEQEQQLNSQLTETQATLEDEKSGIIDLLRESARVRNQIAELHAHQDTLSDRKDRLQARDSEIRGHLQELLQHKAMASRRVDEIQSLIDRESEQLEDKQKAFERCKETVVSTTQSLATAKETRSGQASQRDILKELEQRMEGVDRAVRDLLHRKATQPDNPHLSCILGMVADLFTTRTDHIRVIEAALERWSQHLVVKDSVAFLALNGDLDNLEGRLSALCLDRLEPPFGTKDFSDEPGVRAKAIDLVQYDNSLERLARHLLGKTIVVDSLETALRLAAEDTHGHEFVTLQGQVVDGLGRMALGPRADELGLISRKSQLNDIEEQLRRQDTEVLTLTDALTRQKAETDHLEHLVSELRNGIYENHAARAEAQTELQYTLEQIERLRQEQPLISSEVESIEHEINGAVEKASVSKESLSELEVQNNARETSIEENKQRADTLNTEKESISKKLTEARVEAGKLAEKKAATQETIYALESTLESARHSHDDHIEKIAQSELRIEESKKTKEECESELATVQQQLIAHEQTSMSTRRKREQLHEQREQLAEEIKHAHTKISELEESMHKRQIKLQESLVRQEELCNRIAEELSINLAEAYEAYDHEQRDWSEVEEEIETLRTKISRLGNINLDAISEQSELEERLGFLNTQQQDLDDSRTQLEALIEKLNKESKDRFVQTFAEIRSNFRDLFRKLFGGGKADLVLDETCEDILEAGIEIFARPPGKELQSISLMSGGEKSMTAIALLMSIFKSKPSPFVFLDEVDAALDEANNERFNSIVQEFLDASQFIIITHSKRTMHVADTLIGVTMQEAGVSRRVSVRFDEQYNESAA